ncbi:three component ABC system middle component [Streptosporangium subroseum]|uniref:three component ABC system middle component n=1 Tax=Streptosporangium subroseum TaxID=106412 RepID=UPI00352F6538
MPSTRYRAIEAAALFNPVFGAYILTCAVNAAIKAEAGQPLSWPSAFLVLPLVLPEDTRADLPVKASRSMAAWLADHPQHRALFPQRAAHLTEYTRASLRTGVRHGALQITAQGIRCPRSPRKPSIDHGSEVVDCAKKAILVGRWLAVVNSATAFTLLGVRP